MNLSAIWIRRPVMTVLVMLTILFFGLFSYDKLPINNLPNVDFPTIQVTAGMPGASPENMAATVATPLEKEFTKIAGLQTMNSTSSTGATKITLQFSLDRNIDAVAQDVNTAISAARAYLPNDMPQPPSYSKTNPANQPIMYFIMTSQTMPMPDVQDFAENFVSGYLSTVDGVAEVKVMGAQKKAVRIKLDPQAMAGRSIGMNEVVSAVQAGNVNRPGGTLDGAFQAFTIESNGQLNNAEKFNRLIIAYRNGKPVTLADVGRAEDGVDYEKVKLWFMTKDQQYQAIVLAISKQPGQNTVKIAADVKAKIPQMMKMMPPAVEMHLFFDQSGFIKESINDVQFTLLLTIFLVVVVIFVFIRSLTPTIIPGIAVPLSLIATFSIMYLLGYSLNTLSLMALTLSVGFVVDDAVVMMENIIRRMEMGENALEASLTGSKEVGFTILSMTISLFVVFIPILFMGGIVGRLFREFAVSIGVAILVSGFISLTLTPMLCSRLLKNYSQRKKNRFYDASEQFFNRARDAYGRALKMVLHHRFLTLMLTLLVLVFSGILFMFIDKGFIPSQDQDYFLVATLADDRASFGYMVSHQEKINEIARIDPSVKALFAEAGGESSNGGFLLATLKKRDERPDTVDEIMNRLRPKLNSVPGLHAFLFNPPPISIGGRQSNAAWQYTLKSNDLDELYKYTKIIEDKMLALPGLTDVNSDLKIKSPRVQITIDRNKASALGLSMSAIQDALYSSYGSRSVSTIYGVSNEYYVYVELGAKYTRQPTDLSAVYLKLSNGKLVALSTIATLQEKVVPLTVNHSGQLPSATISFNLKEGFAIDKAMKDISDVANKNLPATVSGTFEGASEAFASSFASLGFLLFVTVFIIYVVLGILYESYIHPITILSALPLAAFGAIAALMIFRMPLDLYAFVGIIMLVGLVKKNGIMMVDFAVEAENIEGLEAEEAIYQACVIRFRPIMMTTMAALFGTLPIALGIGAGGDARQPLGVAVVGGLLFSQMLTLFVTPVFYVYLNRLRRKQRRVMKTAQP